MRIHWLTAPMKSSHVCGGAVQQDAEASFRAVCSHCPRLPGRGPTFTISSPTKTCNDSNRRGQPNKYSGEELARTPRPADSDNSSAKLRVVMIACIGSNTYDLTCLLQWHSPAIWTLLSKEQLHSRHSHCKYHNYNCMGYESCCVQFFV